MAKISPLMILPPLIFAGFVGFAAVGMFREDPNSLPSTREGKQAPALTMSAFGDKPEFDDATLRDGEVKLVNFWASWCAPCRAEHPNLEALSDEGLPVYGINYKDSYANASAFLEELGDPYTALGHDEPGRTGIDWGVYGVPETYVIAGDGTVVLRFAGPVTQRVIAEKIRPALEKAASQ
jgi:cytochrome c biogenesis protein CcmG/thiol:disulfide interchange protein DsbE